MNLIIHAGTHKTATTSFQYLCFSNKHELSKIGIFIPEFKNKEKIINVASRKGIVPNPLLSFQHNVLAWYIQLKDINEVKEFLLNSYENAIKENCKNVLLTAEDFENILIEDFMAKNIESIAKEIGFSQIEWIFVKRNPFEYLKSIYAELSKHGKIINYNLLHESIILNGYFSAELSHYKNYFVFDLDNFVDSLIKENSSNISIIKFEDFILPFVGFPIFKNLVEDVDLKKLSFKKWKGIERNKSLSSKQIELNYLCNFFQLQRTQKNYNNNKAFFNQLISLREREINNPIDDIRNSINNKFS